MTGSIPPAWTNSGSDSWERMPTSGCPGRPEVADQGGPLALEHGQQAGDGALDRLLEHDVGLVEAGRRPVAGIVADLDPQGRAGRHDPSRGRVPRSAGRWPPARGARVVVGAAAALAAVLLSPRVAEQATTTPISTTATPPSDVPPGAGPAAVRLDCSGAPVGSRRRAAAAASAADAPGPVREQRRRVEPAEVGTERPRPWHRERRPAGSGWRVVVGHCRARLLRADAGSVASGPDRCRRRPVRRRGRRIRRPARGPPSNMRSGLE